MPRDKSVKGVTTTSKTDRLKVKSQLKLPKM